jgi:hypothetical protein
MENIMLCAKLIQKINNFIILDVLPKFLFRLIK